MTRRGWTLAFVAALAFGAGLVWWQFRADITAARLRVSIGSTVIHAPCGNIEYQEAGASVPLLAVHGSGGGFDQGMAFAAPLATKGVRVIAISRKGYLRTPMPADASAEAQAHAVVCLLDAMDIDQAAVMGGSAGALLALQMAIRHPDQVSALVLRALLAWKPPTESNSAEPLAPWIASAMMSVIGLDFLFWSAQNLACRQLIGNVLATSPELLQTANAAEQARIGAIVGNIMPVSARAAGLHGDTAVGKTMTEAVLDRVTAPTLIISARDDRYGVDLIKVKECRLRASGLMPEDPTRYLTFGTPVLAPCAGRVVLAEGGRPDMPVPQVDEGYPVGNHVLLRCGNYDILLPHFRQGSLRVAVADGLALGQQIAEIGDSGESSDLHLHTHAQMQGTPDVPFGGVPVPIRLAGRFLVRGDLVQAGARGQ